MDRQLGFLNATALNMANMLGAGPFITISTLMSALGGPQSMLGWAIAVLIAIPDGMVWSELGAALPGSGGTFRYVREGFGRETWGRLMAFLFLVQLLMSGPLEIASGYIGFARYLDYLLPGILSGGVLTWKGAAAVIALGLLNIALLYRPIRGIGRLLVALWIGVLLTVGTVLMNGALHFDTQIAFDLPAGAFQFSWGFLLGLGAATRTGLYDFLGYYDICYLGDEVRDPGRTIPRSVLTSLVVVALIYVGINLSINGVIPWRQFVPEDQHPEAAYIASAFIERLHGPTAARIFTVMVLWTCVGSVVALLLGYSRIPYAAARDGVFFATFGRLHPRLGFPHLGLLLIGLLAIAGSFLSFGTVLDTLIALRILVQFVAQIAAVVLLRRNRPDLARPYKIWLYPLPLVVALFGWLFVFVTSPLKVIGFSAMALLTGVLAYGIWSWRTVRWPFGDPHGEAGEAPSGRQP